MKRLFLLLLVLLASLHLSAQAKWQILPDSLLNLHVTTRYRYEDVYFTDSVTGYAAAYDGYLYQTRDAGRTWKLQVGLPNQASFRSIEFLNDKFTGIAGCINNASGNAHFIPVVYRTTDGGNSWSDIGAMTGDTINDGYLKGICGIAHYGSTFYLVGSWFSKQAKVYKSADKGVTWQTIYLDTSMINCAVDAYFKSADTGFVTGAYIGSSTYHNPTTSVVIQTTDGGLNWKRVFSDTSIGGRIWKIQAVSSRMLVGSIEPAYSDTVAMIMSTDGGANWRIVGTGHRMGVLIATSYRTQGIGFINEQHGWLGGWYNGLCETKDGGQSWDTVGFGSNLNRFFVLDSTHVFAGGTDIYFYGDSLPYPTIIRPTTLLAPPHKLYPISPNPARGKMKIEFDLLKDTYVLLDVSGIDVKRSWELKNGWLTRGHYTYYWDSRQASDGNYIVWLGTNEIPIVQKFVLRN